MCALLAVPNPFEIETMQNNAQSILNLLYTFSFIIRKIWPKLRYLANVIASAPIRVPGRDGHVVNSGPLILAKDLFAEDALLALLFRHWILRPSVASNRFQKYIFR